MYPLNKPSRPVDPDTMQCLLCCMRRFQPSSLIGAAFRLLTTSKLRSRSSSPLIELSSCWVLKTRGPLWIGGMARTWDEEVSFIDVMNRFYRLQSDRERLDKLRGMSFAPSFPLGPAGATLQLFHKVKVLWSPTPFWSISTQQDDCLKVSCNLERALEFVISQLRSHCIPRLRCTISADDFPT
jgi:hypothetical protein